MFKRDQPLFSRPVLAAIIIVSTLAIWLLNLTAPKVDLSQPEINGWQTNSGIPVTFVTQEDWQAGNKIIVSIAFNGDHSNQTLTSSTLSMLAGPSLPLSTATINQRLSPIAAQVDTHVTQHYQLLQITMSNNEGFLNATFKLLDTWLNQTQFKTTALQRLQRQQQADVAQQSVLQRLIPQPTERYATPIEDITLEHLNHYLQHLRQHVSHIVVAGAITDRTLPTLQTGLNAITADMNATKLTSTSSFATQATQEQLGDGNRVAMYGAIGLNSLESISDWLAIQIWARDMLQTQKQRFNSQVSQWQLHLTPPTPHITWQLQVPPDVLQTSNDSALPDSAWIAVTELPSYKDADQFEHLKTLLLNRLKQLSQTPEWWTQVANQVTPPAANLSLEAFAQDYSEAANSFTMTQYQQHIDRLLRPSSLQETQVHHEKAIN